MRSSTSSSDGIELRAVPPLPWGRASALALLLTLAGLGGWEAYWRGQQFRPSYRNSDGLWALTRRQVDRDRGEGTVVIGSSRALFDINLETWAGATGRRPIQLALEGTSPRPMLTHLAKESSFHGLLVVGVTPPLFFSPGFGYRAAALERYRTETPSQRAGQWMSMTLLEPWVAFYNFDTELFRVLARQTWWPARPGLDPPRREVRKLANLRVTRQSDLWTRLESDPSYARLCQDIWTDYLKPPKELPPADAEAQRLEELFRQVAEDVATIHARGGEVVFVRLPSRGPFREAEAHAFPRQRFWDVLLERTGAAGVHFEDHAELQGMTIPEWSHVSARDTDRLTRGLISILRRELAARGVVRAELGALDSAAAAGHDAIRRPGT